MYIWLYYKSVFFASVKYKFHQYRDSLSTYNREIIDMILALNACVYKASMLIIIKIVFNRRYGRMNPKEQNEYFQNHLKYSVNMMAIFHH